MKPVGLAFGVIGQEPTGFVAVLSQELFVLKRVRDG